MSASNVTDPLFFKKVKIVPKNRHVLVVLVSVNSCMTYLYRSVLELEEVFMTFRQSGFFARSGDRSSTQSDFLPESLMSSQLCSSERCGN